MHSTPLVQSEETLLAEKQAADLLRLSIRTLQAWRLAGRGPSYIRAGRAIRYRRHDITQWIAANTVTLGALS